jgi:molybdopterin synthase catalytic subunit
MAKKKLQEIADEAKKKWSLEEVAVTHRLGRMEIGDIAVVIAVSAGHRQPAFEACQYTIDRIKEIVPIWKKEFYEDGEVWIEERGGSWDRRHRILHTRIASLVPTL